RVVGVKGSITRALTRGGGQAGIDRRPAPAPIRALKDATARPDVERGGREGLNRQGADKQAVKGGGDPRRARTPGGEERRATADEVPPPSVLWKAPPPKVPA